MKQFVSAVESADCSGAITILQSSKPVAVCQRDGLGG